MTTATRKKFAPKSVGSTKPASVTRKPTRKTGRKQAPVCSNSVESPSSSAIRPLPPRVSAAATSTPSGAAAARQPHKLKVAGAIPASASVFGDLATEIFEEPVTAQQKPVRREDADDEGAGLEWTLVAVLYAIVWLVTHRLAASGNTMLAFGVASAFVLVPGAYVLLREVLSIESVLAFLSRRAT